MVHLFVDFWPQLIAIFVYWAGLVGAAIGVLDIKLQSPSNRKSFLKLVGSGRLKLYVWIFHKVLPDIDRFFWATHNGHGSIVYGFKTWWRCNQISFVYPVYFTFIGWAFGNVSALGGINAFYADRPKEIRFVVLVFITIHVIGLMYFFEKQLHIKIAQAIFELSPFRRSRFYPALETALEELICGLGGMYFGCIFGIGVAAISPLITYSQAIYAGAISGLVIGLVAGMIGGGPISTVAGLIIGAFIISDRTVVCLIALFFGILPIVNGLFDYASLCMTRYLLGRILITRFRNAYLEFGRITIYISLDIAFSLFCILLLTIALFVTISLYNKSPGVPTSAHVVWTSIVQEAYQSPFGTGLPVTLMLWSTFLPTAFNLILTSIIFIFRTWRRIAIGLQKSIPIRSGADLSVLMAIAGASSFLYLHQLFCCSDIF